MALAPTDIKVAGHWKSVDQVRIKVVGHWKPVDQIMEKVAGHWKHIGTTAHPPLFTGAIGDLTAVVGEAFTKDVSHLFSTGPVPASYSLNNPPAGMVISNAGVISWPSPVKGDTSGVSVTATNAGGFAVSDAFGVSADVFHIVKNGGFDADLSDWSINANSMNPVTWEAPGVCKIVSAGDGMSNSITQPLQLKAGDYTFSADFVFTAGFARVFVTTQIGSNITSTGHVSTDFNVPADASKSLIIYGHYSTPCDFTVDNIEIVKKP